MNPSKEETNCNLLKKHGILDELDIIHEKHLDVDYSINELKCAIEVTKENLNKQSTILCNSENMMIMLNVQRKIAETASNKLDTVIEDFEALIAEQSDNMWKTQERLERYKFHLNRLTK